MKEYVKLSVEAEGHWSGSTYYEELFLPKEAWEEIKDNFGMHMYIYELDGKHSEVRADIEVEDYNESELVTYNPPQSDDGENLYYQVYEELDDKYDKDYLTNIQEEVRSLCQAEILMIKFNKQNKDKIMELLKGYLL